MKGYFALAVAVSALAFATAQEEDGLYHPERYGDDGSYRPGEEGRYAGGSSAGGVAYNAAARYNQAKPVYAYNAAPKAVNYAFQPAYEQQVFAAQPLARPVTYAATPAPAPVTYAAAPVTYTVAAPLTYTAAPAPVSYRAAPVVYTAAAAAPVSYSAPAPVPLAYAAQKSVSYVQTPSYTPFVQAASASGAVARYANDAVSGRTPAILKLTNDLKEDGYYYQFETENGIAAEEAGKVNPNEKSDEGTKANGYYEYVGDDGAKYRVDYIADENGFRASGAHLPTPPPLPEAIAKALAVQGLAA